MTLFDPIPPTVPHNRTDTSKAAADAITVEKLCRQKQQVLVYLYRHGPRTRRQIAEGTGLLLNAVCGRVTPLMDAGLIGSARKVPGPFGALNEQVKLTETGFQLTQEIIRRRDHGGDGD